jgi:hypothetical protein
LGKKEEPKRSQKIHKIWRRKERKNSTPLELFFFLPPQQVFNFVPNPLLHFPFLCCNIHTKNQKATLDFIKQLLMGSVVLHTRINALEAHINPNLEQEN